MHAKEHGSRAELAQPLQHRCSMTLLLAPPTSRRPRYRSWSKRYHACIMVEANDLVTLHLWCPNLSSFGTLGSVDEDACMMIQIEARGSACTWSSGMHGEHSASRITACLRVWPLHPSDQQQGGAGIVVPGRPWPLSISSRRQQRGLNWKPWPNPCCTCTVSSEKVGQASLLSSLSARSHWARVAPAWHLSLRAAHACTPLSSHGAATCTARMEGAGAGTFTGSQSQ